MKKMHIRFLSSFLFILCLNMSDVSSFKNSKKFDRAKNNIEKMQDEENKPYNRPKIWHRPKIWRCWKKVGEGSFGEVYKIDDKRALKIVGSGRVPLLNADEFEGESKNLASMKDLGNEIVKDKREYFCAPSRIIKDTNFCQAEFDLAISDANCALGSVYNHFYRELSSGYGIPELRVFLETLIVHTLKGLSGLHQYTNHGDAKMANILLFLENGKLKFKLNDIFPNHPFNMVECLCEYPDNKQLQIVRVLLDHIKLGLRGDDRGRRDIACQSLLFEELCIKHTWKKHIASLNFSSFLKKFDIYYFICDVIATFYRNKLDKLYPDIYKTLIETIDCDTVEQALNLESVKNMIERVKTYENQSNYDWNKIFNVKENDKKETKIVNTWKKPHRRKVVQMHPINK